MNKVLGNRKLVISVFVVLITLASAVALGPVFYSLFMGKGVKTEPIDTSRLKAASTDLNGDWKVVKGDPRNHSSVGFTFDEVLPAERTRTSGSTTAVTGQASIDGGVLESGSITVDMTQLGTDKKVRDQNMKSKLFITEKYPESSFNITQPADLSAVPDDGSVAKVKLTGDLQIKDAKRPVTQVFDVVRDGDLILLGGTIPVNRLDYDIQTPDMIAAKIAENGEVNIRIALAKQ